MMRLSFLPFPRTAVLALLLCALAGPRVNAQEQLPKLSELQWPAFDELMTSQPFDWVVLQDESVLVTDAIWPRPDPWQALQDEKAELETKARKTKEDRERLLQLRYLDIVLLEDQSSDYRLPFSQVQRIISFPMLMLGRVERLLEEGEITRAYELLMEVDRIAPNWDKAQPQFDQLLLREAQLKVEDNNLPAALALLDELASRNLQNPQLPVMLADLLNQKIDEAMNSGDYPRARYYLNRFARHFPRHEFAVNWQQRMQDLMKQKLDEGLQLRQQGKHREAAELALEAEQVWTPTGSLRVQYSSLVTRYQQLRVPVRRFSSDNVISPIPLEADLRHLELTTVPLFEPTAADELTYFQSSFFELWDPRDLGREVVFSLRQRRPYWQSQPILSANQIADALGVKLSPESPDFNPRLVSFIREFSVRSPSQLQISFHRVPLNLEAMFNFPVHAPSADRRTEGELLSKRFELVESTEDRRLYRRSRPEPDDLNERLYHVAEVEEIRFEDRDDLIRAFRREQVDVIPHLRPWEVDLFLKFPDQYAVQKYAIPQTHVIVFNPLSEKVTSPQLRRALSLGVDRENLLKIVLLRDPEMKYGRPVSAPWHTESYANSPLVDPPRYDHYLSYLLRMAALEKKRIPFKQKFVAEAKERTLKAGEDWNEEVFRREQADEIDAAGAHVQLPTLKLLVDPDDVVMLAAEKMVERWQLLGFDIELVSAGSPGETSEDWDMLYRRARMKEPLLELWPLLLTDDTFDVTRLANYPDWMRQELINLDYATSFMDAQQKLYTIHRHMAAQAFLIPLWEIDDFMVFPRTRVKNFEGRPLSVYHGLEKWTIVP